MFRRPKFNIDDVAVAAPCPVSWEGMESIEGDERIRHCTLCRLNVYNLSDMTRKEVKELFQNSDEQLCIRLYRRQDGTIITRDCPVGRRLADACKRKMRATAAALLAFLHIIPAKASDSCDKESAQKTTEDQSAHITNSSESKPAGARWGIAPNYFTPEKQALPRAGGAWFKPNVWPKHVIPGQSTSARKAASKPIPKSNLANAITPTAFVDNLETHKPSDSQLKQSNREALDAFIEAQRAEATGFNIRAAERYQFAIYQFTSNPDLHDLGFRRQVARAYAAFLRKQKNPEMAAAVWEEFGTSNTSKTQSSRSLGVGRKN